MLRSDLAVDWLGRTIARLAAQPWRRCAARPWRDFTRERKLTLEVVLRLLVSRDCLSVQAGLLDRLGWTADAPIASAWSKARRKLGHQAMPLLNSEFLRPWDVVPYRGAYRLILADDTGIPIPASDDGDHPQGECHVRRNRLRRSRTSHKSRPANERDAPVAVTHRGLY